MFRAWRRGTILAMTLELAVALVVVGVTNGRAAAADSPSKFGKTTKVRLALPDFSKGEKPEASLSGGPTTSPSLVKAEKPSIWRRMSDSISSASSSFASGVKSAYDKSTDSFKSAKAKPNRPVDDPTALRRNIPNQDAAFYVAAARVHEAGGNDEGAEEQYRQALSIDPANLEAMLGYARLMDRTGRLADATQLYRQATNAHPTEAAAFNDLSLCLARQRQFEPSVAALRHAIELRPDRKLYRNNLATVMVEYGRYPDALEELVAAHGPAVGNYNLGYLLTQKGDHRAAAYHFNRAVEIDPSFTDARQWLDQVAQRTNAPQSGPMTAPQQQAEAQPSDISARPAPAEEQRITVTPGRGPIQQPAAHDAMPTERRDVPPTSPPYRAPISESIPNPNYRQPNTQDTGNPTGVGQRGPMKVYGPGEAAEVVEPVTPQGVPAAPGNTAAPGWNGGPGAAYRQPAPQDNLAPQGPQATPTPVYYPPSRY